ncbi:urea ABC transporter permease subunit UrtB [Denitromonas ohlonensis]|uniref:Urea ABC transporter permease subunit UrtB n=2 Tax=Denitromonas TaxID=139331 RepID=A0A557RSA8_9RHOO|nr:urea ABC transporter permease subunit UrtB [Denitromonas ohlonensis]TVO68002.1 urea ABC transporter permease subunit UrtB [Denitromonas ohlonensis]TVO78093.1 urea ABC transporter permease subunit UrtB [Denitromonas ohlonensis]TVT78455.1 MAG: urea ABC transporter permease subunit UrtB [Denitromonas halophila]
MPLSLPHLLRMFLLAVCCALGSAHAAPSAETLARLTDDDSDTRIAAIAELGAEGSAQSVALLDALADEALALTGAGRLVILTDTGALDAATGEAIEPYPDDADPLMINNRVRNALQSAKAATNIRASDRGTRLAAAQLLRDSASELLMPILEPALAAEQDKEIRSILALAVARVNLASAEPAKRILAAQRLGDSSDASVKAMLATLLDKDAKGQFIEPDTEVRAAAKASVQAIERRLAMADLASTAFTGLSLGSILLLAALGLAITYGVMGVINMAHGELLMVGAYATYVVQGLFRTHLPEYIDSYVIAAVPVAFLTAAAVGMLMERTVIRWLYGRPLETLLATWGLSLVLIQSARVIFGPQNVEVANPAWMSGGFSTYADIVLPWNRVVIIGFAIFVLLLVWLMMQKTRLGMFVRAVTQNRAMAGCVGVPTARIDTLAFGIGAGIAGLGGCALSQVANVGPAMGQGYIVDSFMVVVLGGVGQLAGAVTAAMGLGLMTKILEGWAGAVVAKILVLVFIIIFIQKRPQGLFALKGRFVED